MKTPASYNARTILILALLILSNYVLTAQDLTKCRKTSYYTYIFKISNEKAFKVFNIDDFIEPDQLTVPVDSFISDSGYSKELSPGYYVYLNTVKERIVTKTVAVNSFGAFLYKGKKKLLLQLYSKKDFSPIAGATVNVKGRKVRYSSKTKTYSFRGIKEGIVKVNYNNEDAFFLLAKEEEDYYHPKFNLKDYLRRNFSKRKHYYYNDQYNDGSYIVFTKPKYLPKDTVKFKALLLNKKGKYFNTPVKIKFGKEYGGTKKEIAILNPISPGAYTYQFVLSDTLSIDTEYEIDLIDSKNEKELLRGTFNLEDYQLDETTFHAKTNKEMYYSGEPIELTLWGKDANGFYLGDGRVELAVKTGTINNYYSDSLFIPKKLWSLEQFLEPSGETKIIIPDSIFPKTDMNFYLTATFNNSNNETHDTIIELEYQYINKNIKAKISGEFVLANYFENGKERAVSGTLTQFKDGDKEKEGKIFFPFKARIDPSVASYNFNVGTISASISEDELSYKTGMGGYHTLDSVFISTRNPYNLDITYTLRKGSKVLEKGITKNLNLKIKDNAHDIYYIEYHFTWARSSVNKIVPIQFYDKETHISISQPDVVSPGEKANVKIKITDSKNRPIENVNLTALAVNSQFKEIKMPYLPYLGKLKNDVYLNNYHKMEYLESEEDFDLISGYWRTRMGLDTMTYYKMLFPKNGIHYNYDTIQSRNSQLAPYLFSKGNMEFIYIIYIDDTPVYYYKTDNAYEYSFIAAPGYHSLRLRTFDKEYFLDSVLLKKGKKLDLAIDALNLPKCAHVEKKDNELSAKEKNAIYNSMISIYHNSNEKGYLWQDNKVFIFSPVKYGNNHIYKLGGFFPDKMYYAVQNKFNRKFDFQPGYNYSVSNDEVKMMCQAENNNIDKLLDYTRNFPEMGMKAQRITDVALTSADNWSKEYITYNPNFSEPGNSTITYDYTGDSTISLIILNKTGTDSSRRFYRYTSEHIFYDLDAGYYNVTFITPYKYFMQFDSIKLGEAGNFFFRFGDKRFKIFQLQQNAVTKKDTAVKTSWQNPVEQSMFNIYEYGSNEYLNVNGSGALKVLLTDKKTKESIPFASIVLFHNKTQIAAGTTDIDGYAFIKSLPAGKYSVKAVYVGYQSQTITGVIVNDDKTTYLTMSLSDEGAVLQEVLCYSVPLIDPDTKSGGTVDRESYMAMADKSISSVLSTQAGVYTNVYIDGERVIGTANVARSAVANMGELDEASATDTTKVQPGKELRNKFADYAYWKPNMITDKNGEAFFETTFPDNNTSWKTYVLAVDDKKHTARASGEIKSFKKIMASIAMPRFMTEGDSAIIIGKALNYSNKKQQIKTHFNIGQNNLATLDTILETAIVQTQAITTQNTDSVKIAYLIEAATGPKDGEEKTIPVLPKGTLETEGLFKVLNKDTVFSVSIKDSTNTEIYVQDNPLNVMLDELNQLQNYPYWCMEQTASKVNGYLMEKNIYRVLGKQFTKQKELNRLIRKLNKAQKKDGSWGWWEDSPSDIWMTCYITRIMNIANTSEYGVSDVTEAVNFLYHSIGSQKGHELLYTLQTLSDVKAKIPYADYIKKIEKDSLDFYQKLIVTRIKQSNNLPYDIKFILAAKKETMLQGYYWGEENQNWHNNSFNSTLLAYKIIEKYDSTHKYLPMIRNYFFELRSNNKWYNTIQTASAIEIMLPGLLRNAPKLSTASEINFNGVLSKTVTSFPFKTTLSGKGGELKISYKGNLPIYFTAYKRFLNKKSAPKTDYFSIKTHYETNGKRTDTLKAGNLTTMAVELNVRKKAGYIMVEVPVPAGCTYDNNNKSTQSYYETHREYYKNKTILYFQELPVGSYTFNIMLQPRFAGNYTVNPVRAEMMYFPVFFGRNGIQKVLIR